MSDGISHQSTIAYLEENALLESYYLHKAILHDELGIMSVDMLRLKEDTKGFTLIELLVVIAIILILAAIIYVNLVASQQKARDAKRIEQIHQLTVALEFYRSTYGRYPTATGTYVKDITGLVPKYISVLPEDPFWTGPERYRYTSDDYSKGYTILIDLEQDSVVWCRVDAGQPGSAAWESSYPLCNM